MYNPDISSWPVTIGGLGRIGSAFLLNMPNTGMHITLYDDDVVEEENLLVQRLYRSCDIGKKKAEAAYEILTEYHGFPKESLTVYTEKITAATHLDGIIISGVDSMKSRAEIWEALWKNIAFIPLYLDGRLGKEVCELHVVQPPSLGAREWYERSLFPDAEGVDNPCSREDTIYPALGLAAMMFSRITRLIHNELPQYERLEFDYRSTLFHAWSHEERNTETSEERR